MRTSTLLLILIPILWVAGCTPKEDPVKLLQEQVIAVHDEVMPLMGSMAKMKSALQAKADGMLAAEADSSALAEVYEAISALDGADSNMMQWMRDFNPPADDMPTEKALAYLKDEMVKITSVKEMADKGLGMAQELLNVE